MSNIINNNIKGKDISMKQLELRAYSRVEISEVLGVNIADSNHFKRNVESKLNRWGYSYEYSRKQVVITRQPTTAEERLSEMMIRAFNMDVRIDSYTFAAFIYSLVVYPEFVSMPWEERAKFLEDEFNITVSDRTLRSWCSHLIESHAVVKDNSYLTRWITGYCNGEKYRELVDGDPELEQFADDYWNEKKELLEEFSDLPAKEKWDTVRKTLWDRHHCCLYCCKGIVFSAWNDEMSNEALQEVIELVNEIAEKEPSETILRVEQSMITSPIVNNGQFHF